MRKHQENAMYFRCGRHRLDICPEEWRWGIWYVGKYDGRTVVFAANPHIVMTELIAWHISTRKTQTRAALAEGVSSLLHQFRLANEAMLGSA